MRRHDKRIGVDMTLFRRHVPAGFLLDTSIYTITSFDICGIWREASPTYKFDIHHKGWPTTLLSEDHICHFE